MKKLLKIALLIFIGLILLFIGFVIYNGYNYSKFYDEAENLGSVIFSSEIFNQRLSSCSLSYADTWEIRGIENDRCIVNFNWDNDIDYNEGIITHNWISCSLPYNIYISPENIYWRNIINQNYCILN